MTSTTLTDAPARRRFSIVPIYRAIAFRLFGKSKWIAWLLMIGLLAVRFWDPVPVQLLRLKLVDTFQQIAPREQGDFQVMVADIDETSLAKIGQWPWPRPLIGQVVQRLMEAGAVVVGFDVFFSEPDRLSPPRFAAANPSLDPAIRNQLESLPDTDQDFARIINEYHAVLGQTGDFDANEHGAPPGKPALAWINADPRPFLATFPTIVGNTPVLENAAVGRGMASATADPDGLIRRIPAVVGVRDGVYPTLSIEMLRVAFGSTTLIVKSDPAAGVEFIGLQFPDKPNVIIPTDGNGRLLPHFAKYNKGRYISLLDIAGPDFDLEKLRARVDGKMVIVGASASGLRDIRATPIDDAEPGVEVHAQLIESILSDSLLSQPIWAQPLEVLLTILASILMIVGVGGPRGTLVLGGAAAAGLVGASWYYFSREHLLLDAACPALIAFLVYVTVTFLGYLREESQKKEIQSAFGQYLSPELVAKLAANPDQLQLGGETRDMTIFFSDVRGFSTFSEMFDAHGLTMFMNKYLTPMTEIAQKHRAYIDKYIGDAIMAFWNAPLDDPQHARQACLTVLRMRERMASLQEELNPILKEAADARARALGRPVPVPKLAIGMGVNTGECVVGNMGSHQKTNYSVLGDAVNLASRLEGQSKPYHLDNIIGENTMALTPEFAALEVDLLQVKGKTEPVRVFTLVGDETVAGTAAFLTLKAVHDDLLLAYRHQDWPTVGRLLPACRAGAQPFGIQALYDTYQERMAEMQADPPGADWDGVYVAKTK